MTSCEHDSFTDEPTVLAAETANSFVRFDNGQDEVFDLNELAGVQELLLEYVFPAATDVTVNYTFEGTAQFGTDFSIEGASASGGSITLFHDASSDQITTATLVVDLLADGVIDGDKTLDIVLTSASAASGIPVDAGQGDLFKRVTINIADADCASDLAGTYNFTGTGFLDGASGTVEISDADGNGNYLIDDYAALAFGEPVAYEFSVICGAISAPAQSEGTAATITGTANEETKEIVMNVTLNCCGGEGLMWSLTLTPA